MAWNLANEARAKGKSREDMRRWIEASCEYLKKKAPNHLVAVGYEGFSDDSRRRDADFMNPGKEVSRPDQGKTLSQVVESSCVDYAGIHVCRRLGRRNARVSKAIHFEPSETRKRKETIRFGRVWYHAGKSPEERKEDMKKRDMYFKMRSK